LIKGGFSYRANREIHFAFEIWQASFVNHRIRNAEDYKHDHNYICENPVKAGLNERLELFAWSSASLGMELDATPPGLKSLRENLERSPSLMGALCFSSGEQRFSVAETSWTSIMRFGAGLENPGQKSLRENLERSPEFGGSPLLQRRGATLQRCGKELDFDYAL
jgi:hypothetical protein